VPKEFAIVLNNGSINSAVVTAMAAQRFRPIMIFADTSNESGRMRAAFDQQVAHFKPYREYTIPMALAAGGHAQSSSTVADPRQTTPLGPIMLELLPLISMAVRYGAQHQASEIYLGMRVGPETDELAQATEYFQIWNEMIRLPCAQSEMEVRTPLLELEPWQVVDVGLQVGAPFERTWSCVEESSEPCWACRGCRDREAAFQRAGKPDPLRTGRRN
jgi:hypothetical protein